MYAVTFAEFYDDTISEFGISSNMIFNDRGDAVAEMMSWKDSFSDYRVHPDSHAGHTLVLHSNAGRDRVVLKVVEVEAK